MSINQFANEFTAPTVSALIESGRVNDRIPTAYDYQDESFLLPDERLEAPDQIGVFMEPSLETRTYVKTTKVVTAWDVSLPPLSAQWKDDMSRKIRNVRRRDPNAYPTLKAPQSFIDTGIWPDDVPRPGVGG